MSRDVNTIGVAKRIVGAYSASSLNTADTDGLVTSFATSTSQVVKSGAGLNGALASGGAIAGSEARNVSVTTSASPGTYRTGASYPIVVTGKHWITGKTISESLILTAANGGETINGKVMFKAGEAISSAIPGQVNALGAMEIGCGTAKALARGTDWFRCTTAGTLVCELAEDTEATRGDGLALAPISLVCQADTDYPYAIVSIHEGTTGVAFTCLSAGSQ